MDKKKETNRMVGIHPVGGKLCGGFYGVGFIQNAGFLQHVMNENAIAAGDVYKRQPMTTSWHYWSINWENSKSL